MGSVDTTNTVTVDFPVRDGAVVTYSTNGSGVGGLAACTASECRPYNVAVVAPGRIAFQSAFALNSIDAASDIITFDNPHNFHSGDAVYYRPNGALDIVQPWQTAAGCTSQCVTAGQVLYVRGVLLSTSITGDVNDATQIDPLRIRLVTSYASATASESLLLHGFTALSGSYLTIGGVTFAPGDVLTYRTGASSKFSTGDVDVNIGSYDYCGQLTSNQTMPQVSCPAGGGTPTVVHVDGNNIYLQNHGFQTGDAVLYHGTGLSLSDGTTYYVIRVDQNQIRLADSYDHAKGYAGTNGGTPDDDSDDIDAIAVQWLSITRRASTGPGDNPDVDLHSLARVLTGLEDGRAYYVVDSDPSTGSTFGLSATRGGTAIAIANTETVTRHRHDGTTVTVTVTTRGALGSHYVGHLGIDLRSTATGVGQLRIDLTSEPPAGTELHLLAPGGRPLGQTYPTAGDGVSTALAQGGTGGFADFTFPSAVLTGTSSVSVRVDAASLTAGRSIAITADGRSNQSAYADTTVAADCRWARRMPRPGSGRTAPRRRPRSRSAPRRI